MERRLYEFRIKGRLSKDWREWFDGFEVRLEDGDVTVLLGPVADQSALYGILSRMRDFNVELISVNPAAPGEASPP